MSKYFDQKTVLVTGAAGTIGKKIIDTLANRGSCAPKLIIGLDHNESELFFLDLDYKGNDKVKVFLCDIRDKDELKKYFSDVDIVIHTAALKHVIVNEVSPDQAMKTNINGTENIIAVSREHKVEKVLFTSSDKAVNPTNVMGATKLLGERLISAANIHGSVTKFSSTRFGNVLGSNGSVVSIFRKQIKNGLAITVTDHNMTRFVMTTKDAVDLVLSSIELMQGGELFITKMPSLRITELGETMYCVSNSKELSDTRGLEIVEIGVKPGEKLYEELMSEEETTRALELENYFVVLPAYMSKSERGRFQYADQISDIVTNPYKSSSQDQLSKEKIRDLLVKM